MRGNFLPIQSILPGFQPEKFFLSLNEIMTFLPEFTEIG
jgi:hypothetical protein